MEVKEGSQEKYDELQDANNRNTESKQAQKQEQKEESRSKKERLRSKKMAKNQQNGVENASISNYECQNSNLSHEQQQQSSARKGRPKKQRLQDKMSALRLPLTLDKLLIKPPYVSVQNGCRIVGNFGHSTTIFRRPIIEGQYFLEILIKDVGIKNKNTNYKSAVRVGICTNAFNTSFPLGFGESISYKSVDGSIVKSGDIIQRYIGYKMGDTIGVYVNISPPIKRSDPDQTREGSFVSFYKNGQLVAKLEPLKQLYYCFGVSLFNHSQVQVLAPSHNSRYFPNEAKSYFDSLAEEVPYQDLQSKKIFKL